MPGGSEGLPVKTGVAKMSLRGGVMERLLPSEGRGGWPGAVPWQSMAGGEGSDLRPYGQKPGWVGCRGPQKGL